MTAPPCADPRRRNLFDDDIELARRSTAAVPRGEASDADGIAALEAIEERLHDLVLMDLEIPGFDGHAAAAIRRRRHDVVRLAALSARRDEAGIRQSAEVGMAAHIARPIAPQALLCGIERLLHLPVATADDGQAVDPWQRTSYDDWVGKLGEDRMRGVLRMLDAQLRDLLRLTGDDASGMLHRCAHDVASTAGMLGFAEVTLRCRAVLEGDGEARTIGALAIALEAAITRLDRHFVTDAPGAQAA